MTETTRSPRNHQPLRVGEVVARELRERILAGEYDEFLPKQELLIDEFQVSAPSIREAFRVLEAEGLLTVRRGNIGGAVVRLPGTKDTAYALGLSLQAKQTRVAEVATALWNFEPVAARMCSERPDRATTVVPLLQESIDRLINFPPDGDWEYAAQEFHDLIGEHCGNRVVSAVLASLYAIYHSHLDEYRDTHGGAYVVGAEPRREVIREHKMILSRIERGQADAAAGLVSKHLAHLLTPLLDEEEIVSVTVQRSARQRLRRPASK